MGTAYAGNPGNYPSSVTIPSGSDTPSSTVFATAFEGALDRTAWLYANQAEGWNAPYTIVGVTSNTGTFRNAAWDPLNERWLVACSYNGQNLVNVFGTYDGNDGAMVVVTNGAINYYGAFGEIPTCLAVCQDPASATVLWLASCDPTNLYLEYNDGSAWHNPTYGNVLGTSGIEDVQILTFNGYIILATASTTNAGSINVVQSSNTGFTTPTSVLGTAPGAHAWLLEQNGLTPGSGGLAILAPRLTGYATPFVYTTPDGFTWTKQTTSLGLLLVSTDQITGLAWSSDALGPAWFMTVISTSATVYTKILRSADGITWTLVETLTTNTFSGTLAAMGENTLFSAAAADTQEAFRIVASPNGGLNWYQTNAVVPPTPASGSLKPQLFGAPNQALAMGTTTFRTSQARGFGNAIT